MMARVARPTTSLRVAGGVLPARPDVAPSVVDAVRVGTEGIMRVIDLNRIAASGASSLGGLQRGRDARAHFGLDQVDGFADDVVVEFPLTVTTVSVDFVRGLFGPSIARLGDAFRRHYLIDATDRSLVSFDAALAVVRAA